MWTGGASPGPPGDPLTQMARCANGKDESPPGGSAGANGTRRPPQRRRAAETVNVNVRCLVGAVGS